MDAKRDQLKSILNIKVRETKQKAGTKRCLSNHVGSRWYRAPEINLLEPHYDFASDLWSAACVFYELFKAKQLDLKGKF